VTKAKCDQTIGIRLELQKHEREQLETLVAAHAVGDVLAGVGELIKPFTTMTVTGAVFTISALQGIVWAFPAAYGFLKHFPGVGPPMTEAQEAFFNAPTFSGYAEAVVESSKNVRFGPGSAGYNP